jgi:hypothetical protein
MLPGKLLRAWVHHFTLRVFGLRPQLVSRCHQTRESQRSVASDFYAATVGAAAAHGNLGVAWHGPKQNMAIYRSSISDPRSHQLFIS